MRPSLRAKATFALSLGSRDSAKVSRTSFNTMKYSGKHSPIIYARSSAIGNDSRILREQLF
ncbi:hypothetical protein CH380_15235 [Leptospira adleri]|uniref:Uncharacterized protein n=1 Tax=Leptospira adleri TaxID=2023186 RepID=A0A2M9YLV4_9LEPT|nr:hypothetical protein CH380_15235 [Leptospira adleri]PJZ63685.1 hypothetical protein CH376_02250 [Leptospira adleri]